MNGYRTSAEHLRDALARADLLVRAQIETFRHGLGQDKPGTDWGLPSVPEAEVDRYLTHGSPGAAPEALPDSTHRYLTAAREAAAILAQREEASTVPLRLPDLTRKFSLNSYEQDVLLLCLLCVTDSRYRRLFGYLADNATLITPTTDVALRTIAPEQADTGWGQAMFAASRPLLGHHLLHMGPSETLHLDPRIARHLLDDEVPDDRLAGVLTPAPHRPSLDDLVLDPSRRAALRDLAQRLAHDCRGMLVWLHGRPGSGRRTLAAALCTEAQQPLLVADVRAALREPWPLVVELCYREAALRDAALCWATADPLLATEAADQQHALVGAALRHPGLSLFTAESGWDPAGAGQAGRFLRIDLVTPNFAQRRELWRTLLPPDTLLGPPLFDRQRLAELLANTFQLTAGQICDAIGSARGVAMVRAPEDPRLRADELYEGCRRQAGRRLISFATRIEPRTELTFDDLVLPDINRRQLEELRARITLRSRVYSELGFDRRLSLGRGVVAMFTGGSGTGKTMAAELLAREQGADLYKIDLSAVVSKYVGETEKNLERVFTDAEQANAMIFFDEADALFAKRGEVREARDRWANIEMSFLLQRIEEYRGVVVLATNLRQNIDTAFLRRLHAVVDFPAPDAAGRLRIWRGMFPAGLSAPPEDDLVVLADRFALSGGCIRNAVLDATFRALHADSATTRIGARNLVVSVGREYQKLGLAITPGEFGQLFYQWVQEDLL